MSDGFKSAAELLDLGNKSWKSRALEAEAAVGRALALLPPVDSIRDDDGEDPVPLLVRVSKVRTALNIRCPECGMEGWNGHNLARDSYSGCHCCGKCL